jgi:hypothetical protein
MCAVSQVLTCPRSVRSYGGFGAEGADRSETPFVKERSGAGRKQVMWDAAEVLHGRNGIMGHLGAEGVARVVALALSEKHRHT